MPRVRRAFRPAQAGPHLRLLLSYVTISALGLFLQYLLFSRVLRQVAQSLPSDGELMLGQVDSMLLTLLVGSFIVLLPITFLVGIAASSRWVGPLVRMERFLREVARGEAPEDLRLRKTDELRELASLLNQVPAPLREAPGSERAASEKAEQGRRAA